MNERRPHQPCRGSLSNRNYIATFVIASISLRVYISFMLEVPTDLHEESCAERRTGERILAKIAPIAITRGSME